MRNFNRWKQANELRKKTGKRSGLEVQVAAQLDSLGVKYGYETEKIQYTLPPEERWYSADFALDNGVIVETKGEFTAKDRKKHLLIRAQYPTKDIRFVFSNPNQRISKTSKVTYAMWCEKHGFRYAKEKVPPGWFGCQHRKTTEYEEGGHTTRTYCDSCGEHV